MEELIGTVTLTNQGLMPVSSFGKGVLEFSSDVNAYALTDMAIGRSFQLTVYDGYYAFVLLITVVSSNLRYEILSGEVRADRYELRVVDKILYLITLSNDNNEVAYSLLGYNAFIPMGTKLIV